MTESELSGDNEGTACLSRFEYIYLTFISVILIYNKIVLRFEFILREEKQNDKICFKIK